MALQPFCVVCFCDLPQPGLCLDCQSEEEANQEKIRKAEIERLRELNGFTDEEDELISWKYGENVRD